LRGGSVKIQFQDGQEHTLPIHGIRPLQVLRVLNELGVKDWSELQTGTRTLESIRFTTKIVAAALSVPGKEVWTVERIQESFAGLEEIVKAFVKCFELSDFSLPAFEKPAAHIETPGPYN
jgi:hypothetical protein